MDKYVTGRRSIAILLEDDYNGYMKRFLFLAFFPFFPALIFPQEAGEVVYPPAAILNAAYMGDIEMMKLILGTQHDKDIRDSMGGTALHIAIFSENLEVIKLLLDHGFDINAVVPSNGYTPLHYCVWFNKANAARYLIACNADRSIKDNNGMTPLEKAMKEGKREMIMALSRY